MSLKNFLDLRKKDIQIIEKTVFKNRPISGELFRTFAVIILASGIIYGVSNADNISNILSPRQEVRSFSAVGIVFDISTNTISIDQVKSSDGTGGTAYTFDTSNVTKIETKDYAPLTFSDLHIGDNIIVQGTMNGSLIVARRIISFSETSSKILIPEVATSTATTSSSTDELATTTGTSTNNQVDASSSLIDQVSDAVGNIVDKAKDVVQNVIDNITGTSTPTTTSTSTEESTSTPQVDASSTPPTSSSTPPTSSDSIDTVSTTTATITPSN